MASKPYVDKRSGVWYCKAKLDRNGPWKPVRLGKHDAPFPPGRPPKKWPKLVEERWAEVKEREWLASQGVPTGRPAETPLEPYIRAYSGVYRRTKRPMSVKQLDLSTRLLLGFASERGVKTVQGVSKQFCREYLEHRIASVRASSLKSERGYLSPIWTQAVQDELTPVNPWRLVKIPGKVEPSKPCFWAPGQVARIVGACDRPWLADLVLVLANTGIRISATLAMEWSWVDWGRGVILVPPGADKAGKGYSVALSRVARDVLQRRHAASRSQLVFESTRGGSWSYSWVQVKFRDAVGRAGVPAGTPHDLRHTYGRLLCRSRVPINVVRASLGHSSLQMTARYTEVDGEEAVQFLEDFGVGDQPPPDEPRPGDAD